MSELNGMKVYSIADVQDDGSFFVKKSERDGVLAVYDEMNNAEEQLKINNCANSLRECYLVSLKTFSATQDRIAQLEKEKAELVGFVTKLQLDVSNEIKLEELLERMK